MSYYFLLPLYPIVYVGYITGLVLDALVGLPTTVYKYHEKYNFLSNSNTYVSFDSLKKYTGLHINHDNFKDYIFVVKNNEFVKAPLMVNKYTTTLAYVIDDIPVCDDINEHMIKIH